MRSKVFGASFLLFTLISNLSFASINDSLVGHWAFDEGSGSTAYDSVNGLDGVVHGAQWTSGIQGGALDFNGYSDYVRLPDNNPVWLPQNNFTVSYWIFYYNTPGTNLEDLLDLNSAASSTSSRNQGIGYQSSPTYGDHLLFSFVTSTQTREKLISNQSLEKNKWYHITAVRNGTSQKLYINGQLDASRTCAAGAIDYSGGYDDDKVNIGAGSTNSSESLRYFFDGLMDDLRIYDRALSSGEIQTLAIDHGLVGHWAFDEGSGSTAYDSVNGLDGVVHGAQWTSGIQGGALDFNGVNDYVSVPYSNHFQLSTFTLSAWINPTEKYGRVILGRGEDPGSDQAWGFLALNIATGRIIFLYEDDDDAETFLDTGYIPPMGAWTHVAVTRSMTGQVDIFANGVTIGHWDPTPDPTTDCYVDFVIGARMYGSPSTSYALQAYFAGTIDDARVYSRALSADEIQILAESIPPYTLNLFSSQGGSVTSPGEGSHDYSQGTLVSLVATPQAHYHFVNWTGTAVEAGEVTNPSAAHTTVTMDGDYTLQANFAIDQCTLNLSTTEGGTIMTPGVGSFSYDYGTQVILQAQPQSGYTFKNWSGNLYGTTNPLIVTLKGNMTITANFNPI